MPDAIATARQALQQERTALQAQLDRIEHALTALEGGKPPQARRPVPRQARKAGGRRPRGQGAEAVVAFLAAQGRKAIHGDQILEHLQAEGLAPGGQHPKATLANTLRRLAAQGRVRNIGRNRWRAIRG